MIQAKQQMKALLVKASHMSWGVDRDHLAAKIEQLLHRPLRRNDPEAYITVRTHRQLRLGITSDLLGREDWNLLTSYKDLEEYEARALSLFISNMPQDVLDEVSQEYRRRTSAIMEGFHATVSGEDYSTTNE